MLYDAAMLKNLKILNSAFSLCVRLELVLTVLSKFNSAGIILARI